ncbi:MAG: flagellar biosynthetic protein FliR [Alphaproteobacteria bacterium]
MLEQLLAADVFSFVLVFARLGTAFMVFPGFGEITVPVRIRLGLALVFTAVILPVVSGGLPALPANLGGMFLLLGGEIFVGLMIGWVTRFLITGLQVGGTIIAAHSGLGSAQLFDPNALQQGAITGAFLTTLGVTLLFVADFHHLMLAALVDSYAVFEPGRGLLVADFAEQASRQVAQAFQLGLRIAMPVVVVALVVYLSMGMMGRLIPQIQVFFILLPIQLTLGFVILAITLAAGLTLFLERFEAGLGGFLGAL